MGRSNREILTGGKKYANNRAKKHLVEEVVFNKEDRNEYLTGFHKRKLERQKKAQEFHKEQERLAKIEERKQIKLEREKELLEQMEKYKEQMKIMSGALDESDNDKESSSDEDEEEEKEGEEEEYEEWEGFKSDEEESNGTKGVLKRKVAQVYGEGEDGTEVTIEELPNDIEEIAKLNYVNLKKSKKVLEESIDRAQKYAVIAGAEKPKQKKKKFRYLSKAERRQNNRKAKDNKRRRD